MTKEQIEAIRARVSECRPIRQIDMKDLLAEVERAQKDAGLIKQMYAKVCEDKCAADAEIERLREAQRWIPVTERLPEINEFVLLNSTFQPEHEQVSIGYLYQPDDKRRKPYFQWIGYDNWARSFAKADFICPGCENITHWMPLPQPPIGKDD